MPILSYLVYPTKGDKQELFNTLAALEFCEPVEADNQEVLILVTDTPNDNEEKDLQNRLKQIKTLQSLNMTFGHVGD